MSLREAFARHGEPSGVTMHTECGSASCDLSDRQWTPQLVRLGSATQSEHLRLDQLVWAVPSLRAPCFLEPHELRAYLPGDAAIKTVYTSTHPGPRLASGGCASESNAVPAPAVSELTDNTRMSREAHIRFSEHLGGPLLGMTRPVMHPNALRQVFFRLHRSGVQANRSLFRPWIRKS